MVPIFLAALIAARGLPALLYRRFLDARHTMIAGLMQATSLPFIVAAVAIGEDLDLVDPAEGAALIGAGLLSVLLFPVIGLGLLKGGDGKPQQPKEDSDVLMAM
jgi:Kef-type K+ transport system membrane component KefB